MRPRLAFVPNALEIRAAAQTECAIHLAMLADYFCFRFERVGDALSRLRPRNRRAAKTLRPPLVAMRLRKPCVRFLFKRLG